MGGDGAVCCLYQGIVILGRFLYKHVHSGCTQPALVQGFCQCLLVYQRTSACVYQYGGRFHQCQAFGIDQMLGVVRQGAMQRENIGLGEEFLVRRSLAYAQRLQCLCRLAAHCQHLHAEGLCHPCHRHAYVSKTYNSHCAAIQFGQGYIVEAEVFATAPGARLYLDGVLCHRIGDIKQVCEHHLCHGHGAVCRHVGDRDSMLGGSLGVHHIVASGKYAHIAQLWQGIHHLACYLDLVHQHSIGTHGTSHHILGGSTVVHLHLAQGTQWFPRQVSRVGGICI